MKFWGSAVGAGAVVAAAFFWPMAGAALAQTPGPSSVGASSTGTPGAAMSAAGPQPAPSPAPPPPSAGPVLVPTPPPPPPPTLLTDPLAYIDEFKTGGLVHDTGLGDHGVEHGTDVNIEILFKSPDWLAVIGSPRPHLGGDINTSGYTSSGYTGLTWRYDLWDNVLGGGGGVFVDGSLGGAIHDGYIDSAPPDRKRLGSRVLFRESAELGYQATPTFSIAAFVDHISNANLGRHNAGDTNVGGRFGIKF